MLEWKASLLLYLTELRKAIMETNEVTMERYMLMNENSIAPCGINCSLCSGFQRKKDPCSGCNGTGYKPTYCQGCIIKHCMEPSRKSTAFCMKCLKYPCRRLKDIEKRYRTKYGVKIFENMQRIKDEGMNGFLAKEEKKWKCRKCGEILCMHKSVCKTCNEMNPYYIGTQT